MFQMRVIETRRDQDLDRLPDQLVPRVTKQDLGLRIDHHDFPHGIDNHDAIWCRIQQVGSVGLQPVACLKRTERVDEEVPRLFHMFQLAS